jgi:hypothetical protein
MDILSYGSFRTGSLLWQPRPEAWALTVATWSAFALAPDASFAVRPEAALPGEGDERGLVEPWGPIAPIKRRPEVVVVGHAYAPAGMEVESVRVRLAVGEIDKTLQIVGDRWVSRDGSRSGPARFAKMPLEWQRAAGGPGTSNPVGIAMGEGAELDARGRVRLPNLEPVGMASTTRPDAFAPIGLGPLSPAWPPRRIKLHRHAATWDDARLIERPLPEDFDFDYFGAAPSDQKLTELTGNERIVLEGVHPRFERLVTSLRAVLPRATAAIHGVGVQDVPLRCDTLVIDTDRLLAILVWRGQVLLDHARREGVVVVVAEKDAPEPPSAAIPMSPGFEPAMTTQWEWPANANRAPALERLRPATRLMAETLIADGDAPSAPALPFSPAEPSGVQPSEKPEANTTRALRRSLRESGLTGTRLIDETPTGPALPFAPATKVDRAAEARSEPATPPMAPSESAFPASAPPPMIGPLATPEMFEAGPNARKAPVPEASSAPAEQAPVSAEPSIEDYPIARCAAIAARIAQRPNEREDVLRAEKLSSEPWEKLEEHWEAEIDAELARGDKKLLDEYDATYVATLEKERGPITAAEYARLVAAIEMDVEGRVLEELRLPEDATAHIERVWFARASTEDTV